jgi:hypothetical protein
MTLQEEAKPEAADMAVAAMVVVLERSRRLLVVGVAERITRELVARGDWRNMHGAADAAAGKAIKTDTSGQRIFVTCSLLFF